jgi:flagellar motor switch/type III secretory pathway protein FliN/pSer/pThr/pTyr-binding forkhead associated (FHA) protein
VGTSMQAAYFPRPVAYTFKNLPSLTREELILSNWYSRLSPSRMEWRAWLAEIFGHLLQRPAGVQFQLIQTHLVENGSGEKLLTFGSKQELFLGRDAENEIVLAGKTIASRHARLALTNDQLFLEDLGGTIGTYLWDKRIKPNQPLSLKDGDQFSIFPFSFRVLLETCWQPESNVVLGKCCTRTLSSSEFLATSPIGWRIFEVNPHPKGNRALLSIGSAFLGELQQQLLGPVRLRRQQCVPSDDTFVWFVMLALLEHLNRRLRFPVKFSFARSKATDRKEPTQGILVSSVLAVGGASAQFRLFLPFDLFPQSGGLTTQDLESYPPGLCWSFPVSLGFVDLTRAELVQVEAGDVLVIENAVSALFPNDFSKGWTLIPEDSNFRSLRIDKYFERSTWVGGEVVTAPTSKPEIAQLPLRLQVILGEKELTLSEVQVLSPGSVVELDSVKPESVRLMVNGKVIGEGELVEVEGKIAVRVSNWRSF